MVTCPQCSAEQPDDLPFCDNCGAALPSLAADKKLSYGPQPLVNDPPQQVPSSSSRFDKTFCPNCGAPLEPDSQYCNSCGVPVDPPSTPSLGPPPSLYRGPDQPNFQPPDDTNPSLQEGESLTPSPPPSAPVSQPLPSSPKSDAKERLWRLWSNFKDFISQIWWETEDTRQAISQAFVRIGQRMWARLRGREFTPVMPHIENMHSEKCMDLSLKKDFRFIDQPYQVGKETAFIGREGQVQDLALRILFSDGGAVLVTGYRGVGKTSFVKKALAEAQRLAPFYNSDYKVQIVSINFNFSRELPPVEIMYHIIRQLTYELKTQNIYQHLSKQIREWLDTAYQRTFFSMTSKQAHTVSREAQLGADGLGLTPSAKLGRNLSREKSRTFLPYSTEAAEYDLLRILQGLSQGYKRRGKRVLLKPVLVFDELDKIDSYHVTEESVIPNPYIRHIFGALKTLLTTSGVSFICVAGRDFYELWRVQVARGDSVLESVFAHHIYLECLWQLPRQLLRQVTPQKVTRKGITRRLVNTQKERKESSLADKFEGYLRYQSRGIARRLHRELNRFVSWYNDGLALVFDDNAMRRIDFYDELERVLREHKDWFMSPIVDFDDRGLLKDEYQSVAYLLTDRLLRFQEDAFTITQLVRSAGEVGVELKNKGLDKLANAVIKALKNRHYVEVVENPTSLPVQIIGNREDAASAKKTYYQLTPWVVLRLQDLQGGSDEDIVEPKSKEWLEIGRLGSYDIVDKLGDGGLSIVYLGRNFRTYQRAAIKVARDSGGSIDVNAALEQEVRALQRAAGAGVVTAYGLQEEEPYHYLVLDYCEGKTLEDLIANRSNPLPRKMSVTLIYQIALILQSIHRKGVYRIDLKPSNIAFDRGKMVLIDFGTALIEGDEASLEWKRLPMGTPDYAAPELVSNPMSVDKRADLYALGVIFYQLLTGSPPARVEPDYTILPHDLAPIIRRLLANYPEDRCPDVSTFLRAFPTEVMMSVSEVYEILSEDLQESRVQRSQRTDIIPKEVAKSKRATQPVAKHIPSQSMAPKAAPLSATGSPSGPPSGTPVLVMPNGDIRPLDKEKILIGRLKTCDVVIDDREVSRIHALLEHTDGTYYIADLNSFSGVKVNGNEIGADHILHGGDSIEIGSAKFKYLVPG